MNDSFVTITGILFLATVSEAVVEYLVAPMLERLLGNGDNPAKPIARGLGWRQLATRYSAAAIAIGLCIGYQANLLAVVGLAGPALLGQIVTGLLVGRGSNWLHDFASRWLGS